ncbi:MAG: TRAP transporter small permease [Alphaproteobacteria bacterium]|nr:TRAP transporter small permease [Alphaproteobacteria bacterium]
MFQVFEKCDRAIMAIMSLVVIITNLAVTGFILFLVLARFVLGWSVVGVLEMATFSAIWLYMCGAVIAARNKEHLVVDFLSQSIRSDRMRALHALAVSVIMMVLSLFFLSLAQDMVAWSIKRPQTTAALGLPLILPQSAIVLAAVLCSVYALRDLVKAVMVVFARPQAPSVGS